MATRNPGRRFARRGSLPSRQWTEVSTNFAQSVTATTATVLWGLQAPAAAAGLTALPPEDIIIMRLRGSFNCTLSAVTSEWVVGLTVQDQTWTPAATFGPDADKRWLWLATFTNSVVFPKTWTASELVEYVNASTFYAEAQTLTNIDISPKVKLEAGQGLYLVSYEQTGASTLTIATSNMRMLWQTKRR